MHPIFDPDEEDALAARAPVMAVDRAAHRARAGTSARRRRAAARGRPAELPVGPELLVDERTFDPTWSGSDNERAMLDRVLGPFYRDHVITDVIGRVKGGKEANVYCCEADPSTGLELIAAKIYRPRAHRTMRNDAVYREGRLMLDEQGKGILRDARLKRAVDRKTEFGREVMTVSWIEHEVDMLRRIHADGADVPRPLGHIGSAIAMAYLGDVGSPAPTLHSARLSSSAEASAVFDRLLWHVELMLSHDRVHGDLSAFNVLVWDGRAFVIDFPQAVVASVNPNARQLLDRDVARLAQHFARYGVHADAGALAADLWARYERGIL